MASTPTKNSVPSENYEDLRFNAGKLDEFVTSSEDEYTDRLGVTHLTARGLQNSVAGALLPANNLSDLSNKDTSLSNLGGGTAGISVFKGATAADIRATLSAAASGANTDITSITGSAAKLTTARTLQANLASTTAGSFDGSANTTLGVTGTLPITNGGTGNTTGLAASATKLATTRSILTNLASTTGANFDGTAAINPGVTGVLPRANGGTGQSDVSYLRAESTTAISLASAAFTKLTPTVVTDTKTAYSTGTWTCPATGYYSVVGMVRFPGSGTANIKAMLKLDSATAPTAAYVPGQTAGTYFNADGGAGEAILNLSCILSLTAGATYSLYAYHSYTSALSTTQQALQIIRVA